MLSIKYYSKLNLQTFSARALVSDLCPTSSGTFTPAHPIHLASNSLIPLREYNWRNSKTHQRSHRSGVKGKKKKQGIKTTTELIKQLAPCF